MQFQQLIDHELRTLTQRFRLALSAYKQERPETLVKAGDLLGLATKGMYEQVDLLLQTYLRTVQPKISCDKGCSHCCYTQISPTAVELFSLAVGVLVTHTAAEVQQLLRHCSELQARFGSLAPEEWLQRRERCVLLNDQGQCSVYKFRPLVCRGWNSTSEIPCRIQRVHPGAAEINTNKGYFQIPMVFKLAMIKVMLAHGKGGDLQIPLIYGLPIALKNEQLGAWLAGEDVFGECALRPAIAFQVNE